MTHVVLDTNVVISGHINTVGLEAAVLDLVFNRALGLYVSADILAEYELVLSRPKLCIDADKVAYSLEQFRSIGILVSPARTLSISPDERDNRFLECAEKAKADYLVTGNKRHFPMQLGSCLIVNARELFDLLGPTLKL
jgi:putative PIN family toxin of toxin-antitoxin system